jgi:hypothetical protein
VRLRHPEYKYATHYIPAEYREDNIEYTAVIDMGDPRNILAYSNIYMLEILAGDEILIKPKSWELVKMDVEFSK